MFLKIMGNANLLCCSSKPKQRKYRTKPSASSTTIEFLPTARAVTPAPAVTSQSGWDETAILRAVETCEREFTALIATTEEKPLPLHVQKAGVQVFGIETTRGFLMKSVWECPYSPQDVLAFTKNDSLRLSWDPNLAECRIIGLVTSEIEVKYERYKKILAVSQRDLLSAGKSCTLSDGSLLDMSVSVELPAIPPLEGIVRAHLFLGGYHIKASELGARVALYNEINYGGSLPNKLLVTMSARTLTGFAEAFNAGLTKSARS
jgi:hypothetical protein